MDLSEFREYWSRLRDRTDAVIACVPAEKIDWSPGSGAMTFGDIIRHIALTERWLFIEVACGRPPRYDSHDKRWGASLAEVRALVSQLRRECRELLAGLDDDAWSGRVRTPAGESIGAQKWLRAMIEHEIHHRGQLYLMLRLSGAVTPPIFGLTSEEVRALVRPSDSKGVR